MIFFLEWGWSITCSRFFAWFFLANLGACALSPTATFNSDVLYTNQAVPPWWVSLAPFSFEGAEGDVYFVFLNNDLNNLSIGIKQAEIASLVTAERAITDCIWHSSKPTGSAANKIQGIARVAKAVTKFHQQNDPIYDIYFESYRGFRNLTKHRVYVALRYENASFVTKLAPLLSAGFSLAQCPSVKGPIPIEKSVKR